MERRGSRLRLRSGFLSAKRSFFGPPGIPHTVKKPFLVCLKISEHRKSLFWCSAKTKRPEKAFSGRPGIPGRVEKPFLVLQEIPMAWKSLFWCLGKFRSTKKGFFNGRFAACGLQDQDLKALQSV
jgi:hypothetical protein